MTDLEIELNESLPSKIKKIIADLEYQIDDTGRSNSKVVIFADYILKISSLAFDIENENRIYEQLKNKLPIPRIIESEIKDGKIYLLKEKLKGKSLSDQYYLERPELLYSLAKEAIETLWSVDISNLNLQNSNARIIDFGKKINKEGYLDIKNASDAVVKGFSNFNEIFEYLENNKPIPDDVLTHGDLCIPNIICDGEKLVGFIDLGLMGISNRYHDLAILYRSIKYNFNGNYGKSYPGFNENKLFEILGIKKDKELIKYYLLLDEVLG